MASPSDSEDNVSDLFGNVNAPYTIESELIS